MPWKSTPGADSAAAAYDPRMRVDGMVFFDTTYECCKLCVEIMDIITCIP